MKFLKLIILIWLGIIIFCTCSKSFKNQSLKLRYHKGQLYYSTSELNNPTQYTLGEYGAHNLFDKDKNTCWAEGKSNEGIGETIYWKINENAEYFFMVNGFAKSDSLFKKNNRIKEIMISIYIGANKPGHATEIYTIYDSIKYPKYKRIVLKDTMNPQKINFPFHWENLKKFKEKVKNLMDTNLKLEYFLEFEIKSVYNGSKYNDTCLSDIWLKKASADIKKIYLNKKQNAVMIDTSDEKGIILDKNESYIFQIVEISKNKEWVILIRMPAKAEGTRVETEYFLYNTVLKKKVDDNLISKNVYSMHGFEKRGDVLYLLFLNGKTNQDDSIDLKSIFEKLNN